MANLVFQVQRFAPVSAWSLALLAPDAPDGSPRIAALAGKQGELLADEREGNAWKVPYAAYLAAGQGYFIGGYRSDEEQLEGGEIVRYRTTENANGPNRIDVKTMARQTNIGQGQEPPTFEEVWDRLKQRTAIASDGYTPMLYAKTNFPTKTTAIWNDSLYGTISYGVTVTLSGERCPAYTFSDEFGNVYSETGDADISGRVGANNDTTQHADGKTDFTLWPFFLFFPNVSAGARLRLHFEAEAQLSASVANGAGTWRPANVSVENPAFALYVPPKPFSNSELQLEGNYTAAGSLSVPLKLVPVAKDDGKGYVFEQQKITIDITVPPAKVLLFAWPDGFLQTLVEQLAADATPYTGDPEDGAEERKHREHVRAELAFTLALKPLLAEEVLEEPSA